MNSVKPGRVMTFTAPGGGVTSGVPVLIGTLVVVPKNTVAAGFAFEGVTEGVFVLAKLAGVAWTEGQLIYFDSATGNCTTVQSATARRVGCAALAAAAGDTSGQVRLNGAPSAANVI
jgi:predicted RecA/RadA family phage recombinase